MSIHKKKKKKTFSFLMILSLILFPFQGALTESVHD